MKTVFTTFILLIVATETQAGPLDRPAPPFEYSFFYSKPSSEHTSYLLLFSPLPDKDVLAYFVLTKDGKNQGQFPLRKMSYKDKVGNEKVKFSVSCLSDDLISSTTHINLVVKSSDKSGKDELYQLMLKAAEPRPKRKL